MVKIYEFTPHFFELPIERKGKMTCKVWEVDGESPSVVVIENDFGKDLDDSELQLMAEHIVKNHKMSVVSIEYAEENIKYSPDLLNRLESLLPKYLESISQYLSKRHQDLIKQGAFQDVINDLQYKPFTRIPLNEDTIIPLYGNENVYTDFGVASSLDVLYGLNILREKYPNWKWNDCIGFGVGYGAYILQLVEKISPNTFSILVSKNSMIRPSASDIFANGTELKHGRHKFFYQKQIGKFPLYLNEVQGWTTDQQHPFFFEQRHYDIRNLGYELHLQNNEKSTPLIFIEEMGMDGVKDKIDFIEKLVQYDYPVELFIPDKEDVDNKIVYFDNGKIKVNHEEIFNHYISGYERNLNSISDNVSILPVYNGVYVYNAVKEIPTFFYIPSNTSLDKENEVDYLSSFFGNDLKDVNESKIKLILHYVKNPIKIQDVNYLTMIH